MEENKKFFLAVILAFCIVLAGASCFWLGLQFASDEEKLNEANELEIDTLGKKLAEMTSYNVIGRDYYFYMDNMSNANKLSITIGLIPEDEFSWSEYAKSEYPDDCNGEFGLTCYSRKISKETFERYFHKIFGLSEQVIYESFNCFPSKEIIKSTSGYKYSDTCNLEGNDIICYNTFSGDVDYIYRYIKYNYSKLIDEKTLKVYTKFLGVERSTKENEVTNNDNAIYSDYNLKTIAAHHNYASWDSDSPTKEDLFKKYSDVAGNYELTFKKDIDDNWYWESTKLIK